MLVSNESSLSDFQHQISLTVGCCENNHTRQWVPISFFFLPISWANWISYCSLYCSKKTDFCYDSIIIRQKTGFFTFTHLFHTKNNENAQTFRSLRDRHQGVNNYHVQTWYLFTFIRNKNKASGENMSFFQLTIFRTVNHFTIFIPTTAQQ